MWLCLCEHPLQLGLMRQMSASVTIMQDMILMSKDAAMDIMQLWCDSDNICDMIKGNESDVANIDLEL